MRDEFYALTSSRMTSGGAVEVAEAAFARLRDRAALLVADDRRNYTPSWSPEVSRTMLNVMRTVQSGALPHDEDRDVLKTEIDRLTLWVQGAEMLDDGPLIIWDGGDIDLSEGCDGGGPTREECWVLTGSRMTISDAVEAAKLASVHLPRGTSLFVVDDRKIYAPSFPLELAQRTLGVFRSIRDGAPVLDGEQFIIDNEIDFLECHLEEFEASGDGHRVIWSSR